MKPSVQRRNRAFTLTEVVVSLVVLAVVAVASLVLIHNRDTARDQTAALSGAPAAIDALETSLRASDVAALDGLIVSGRGTALVYRAADADSSASPWCVLEASTVPDALGADGPVYVATLSNPQLRKNGVAVEFDVAVGWIAPGDPTETAPHLKARLAAAQPLCKYRGIVLRK
jgi:prepilin-type N-terminal cleavage/methylation domain-containing protein